MRGFQLTPRKKRCVDWVNVFFFLWAVLGSEWVSEWRLEVTLNSGFLSPRRGLCLSGSDVWSLPPKRQKRERNRVRSRSELWMLNVCRTNFTPELPGCSGWSWSDWVRKNPGESHILQFVKRNSKKPLVPIKHKILRSPCLNHKHSQYLCNTNCYWLPNILQPNASVY